MMCACSMVRGIYTSETLYDFVTLPPDMRFKYQFDLRLWPENFAWLALPADIDDFGQTEQDRAIQRSEQKKARAALEGQN